MDIKKYFKNELFRASMVLLVLINISNILNYVFHFIMGRMLSPADYGVLAVLTSIIYVFSVPTTSIQTLVSKYATGFNVKKENGKIKGMVKGMVFEATILAAILFVIFVIISFFIKDMLGIRFSLLVLTGLYLFGAFLSPIGLGVLQGIKKFSIWGWNSVMNSAMKIIIGVLLVWLGFNVFGPIIGFILGALISFVFVFPFIKDIMNSKAIKGDTSIISRNSLSTLGSVLIITLMYSLDIIFVKILFPANLAGEYSVASMIGKIIFFGTSSISNAMFPISSERFFSRNKDRTESVITKTFLIICGLCLVALFLMGFFPKFLVSILFGSKYAAIAGILFYLGIAYSLLSLIYTFILYKISIQEFRVRHVGILSIFLILQVILFVIFSHDLSSFVFAFMISTIITFIGCILFIRKWKEIKIIKD